MVLQVRHIDRPEDIEEPDYRRFYAYWLEKAQGRPFPCRRDLDPLDFPYALGDLMLIEVLPEGGFLYRLVGTRVVKVIGKELTGLTTGHIADPEAKDIIEQQFRRMVLQACPMQVEDDEFPYDGRKLTFRSIHLPLGSDGKVEMIAVLTKLQEVGRKSSPWLGRR